MQTRSGRVFSTGPLKWGAKKPRSTKFDMVLHEGDNQWPDEQQAYKLATNTRDPKKFELWIRKLMTHMVAAPKNRTESRANRLVLMATMCSLINVSNNAMMRTKFRHLAEMCIRKMEEYDGPEVLEFNLPQFVAEFKSFVR